jgi:multiple sugar transport system permease protein
MMAARARGASFASPAARIERVLLHVLLLCGALVMMLPFVWMISTSFKSNSEALSIPPRLLPETFLWQNYVDVINKLNYGRFFLNSLIVAAMRVGGQLVTCSLAAYAFARLRFPGRNLLFPLYLAALMVPFQVYMIPDFVVMKYLGWLDTLQGIAVPGMFSAFGIFLLRQAFLTVPRELEEAAILDGASPPSVLWRVVLPLSRPALASLAILTFLYSWNDLLWPLLVTRSEQNYVLPIGLALLQGQYQTNWSWLMAAGVMATLPVILLYLFAQRYFVEGIAMTGLKG